MLHIAPQLLNLPYKWTLRILFLQLGSLLVSELVKTDLIQPEGGICRGEWAGYAYAFLSHMLI